MTPWPKSAREHEAAAFIADYLRKGPRSWDAVVQAGKRAGHKSVTMERARIRVAETYKEPGKKGRWYWRLPGDQRTDPIPTRDEMFELPDPFEEE